MTAFKSDFLKTLQARGFIHQISDPEGLDAAAAKGRITAYVGYDATGQKPFLYDGTLPEGIEPPRGRDVFFFWGEEDWIIFVQKRSPAYYIVGLRKIGQSHE